jgi:hypothetical protein
MDIEERESKGVLNFKLNLVATFTLVKTDNFDVKKKIISSGVDHHIILL